MLKTKTQSKLSAKTKDYFIQAVLIVASVLLALWLNELVEDKKKRESKELALTNIKQEIQNNIRSLESVTPYHEQLTDSLAAYIAKNDLTKRDITAMEIITPLIKRRGLAPANLQRTAWDMALETNVISQFDYDDAYRLTKLYDLQEKGVSSTTKMIMNYLTNPDLFDKDRSEVIMQVMLFTFNEMTQQEEYLIEKSKEVLEEFE